MSEKLAKNYNQKIFNIYWNTWNISPIFVSYINGRNGSRLRKEVDKIYLLPKELVQKQKEYLSLPRCPYEVLRTDKYDELIENDVFLQLVWDCYA